MVKSKKAVIFLLLISCILFKVCGKSYSTEEVQTMRSNVVKEAKKYIGCTYKLGGIGPDSFDCSGLIYTVMRDAAGMQMPRTAKALYSAAKVIQQSQLEPGDFVFFKTAGDGQISHVGIYIGRNQFIHAVSDGSNTGVIVSSLKEKYWSGCYAGAGQMLPATGKSDSPSSETAAVPVSSESKTAAVTETEAVPAATAKSVPAKKTTSKSSEPWYSNIVFDGSLACDWNFFLPSRFILNFRGIALTTVATYDNGWILKPGIGTIFRYNHGTGNFQIPLIFSLTFSEYVRAFAGPVINFGAPQLPDGGREISGSFFPGIIGISFQTPSFKAGKTRISVMQNLEYTVFNDADGGALNFGESFITGFVFSTGVRVTLPVKNLL